MMLYDIHLSNEKQTTSGHVHKFIATLIKTSFWLHASMSNGYLCFKKNGQKISKCIDTCIMIMIYSSVSR